MTPHDPRLYPGRARVCVDAVGERGETVQVNITKGPGRLPGAFLLPVMPGYHRQAAKPTQRKYARLGMTWAGVLLLVKR